VGNTESWIEGSKNISGVFVEGYLDIKLRSSTQNSTALSSVWIDNITSTFTCDSPLDTPYVVYTIPFNVSIPKKVKVKLKSIFNKSSIGIISCISFRARFDYVDGPTSGADLTSGLTATTTTQEMYRPVEPQEPETLEGIWLDNTSTILNFCFVASFIIFFICFWFIQPKKKISPQHWEFGHLKHFERFNGFFTAWITYQKTKFEVIGYDIDSHICETLDVKKELLCPFIGTYQKKYHIYARGRRVHIDAVKHAITNKEKTNLLISILPMVENRAFKWDRFFIDPVSLKASFAGYKLPVRQRNTKQEILQDIVIELFGENIPNFIQESLRLLSRDCAFSVEEYESYLLFCLIE
jgi:hypothetical protein